MRSAQPAHAQPEDPEDPADRVLLLEGLAKYDRKRDRRVPIAALQMAVEDLVDRVPVGTLRRLIDCYCKRVQDGFIDFSALHDEWAAAAPAGAPGRAEPLDPHGTDPIRTAYEQWCLGAWGRDRFVQELARLPGVRDNGGVPPRAVSLIERHQFTHGLSFAQFLAALRGNSSAGTVETREEQASKSRGKKHYDDHVYRAPPPYVHPENGEDTADTRGLGYHNTSEAVSSLLHCAPAPRGAARGAGGNYSSTTTMLYHGADQDEEEVRHARRHFGASDKVGELFAGQDVQLSQHEDGDCPWRGRKHFDTSYQSEELSVGGPVREEQPQRCRGAAASAVAKDNGHIAIGQHVSEYIPKTTQELLWGNMIRRAR